MKKLIILFAIFLSGLKITYADIIFFPIAYSVLTLSHEWIFSYEKVYGSNTTINYWGGSGIIYSLFIPSTIPIVGIEAGIEPRLYFNKDLYKKSSLSLYGGLAFMQLIDFEYYPRYFGVVPGIKYTYKSYFTDKEKYFYEPYVSISIPIYMEVGYGDFKDFEDYHAHFPCLTLGIRVGIQNIAK